MQLLAFCFWLLAVFGESEALVPRGKHTHRAETSSYNVPGQVVRGHLLTTQDVSSNSSNISLLDPRQKPWASSARMSLLGIDEYGRLSPWFGVLVLPVLFAVWASEQASGAVIVTAWMLSSIVMNIVNKQAATSFKATALLVVIQMVSADLFILVGERQKLVCGCWKDFMKWMVIPMFFAGMLSTSLLSLKVTTLSTVLVLRNVLPLFAFAVEKFFFDTPSRVGSNLLVSMIVTLIGTVLYGRFNISVTPAGAAIVLCNCVLTVADRVLQRSFLRNPDFGVSISLCMLLNNTLGILPVLLFATYSGEVSIWRDTIATTSSESWCWVGMSGICGCALGFLGLRCQQVISATTFLMLQNFNKIVLIALGFFLFDDKIGRGLPAVGCFVSLLGALWYGMLRLPVETAEHIDKSPHLRRKSPGAGMSPAERALVSNIHMAPIKLPEASGTEKN